MADCKPFSGPLVPLVPAPTLAALRLVAAERERQRAKWGDGGHPDVGAEHFEGDDLFAHTKRLRERVEAGKAHPDGAGWLEILLEEVGEARDAAEYVSVADTHTELEEKRAELRRELAQVAAVAVAWLEDLERRAQGEG